MVYGGLDMAIEQDDGHLHELHASAGRFYCISFTQVYDSIYQSYAVFVSVSEVVALYRLEDGFECWVIALSLTTMRSRI